jgi:hypothetical protein
MAIDTQDPRLAGFEIGDVLVPLVGLTVLQATFGAPGIAPGRTVGADGPFDHSVSIASLRPAYRPD